MDIWNKEEKRFFIANVAIVLSASLLVLYGLKGSVQDRIQILQSFSLSTVKLIAKTIFFFVFGFAVAIFALKTLHARQIEKSGSKPKYGFLIIGWIFYFLGFALLVLKKWATNRFPMDDPEIVYFTLSNVWGGG